MPRGLYGWRRDPPKEDDWPAHLLLGAAPSPPESASLRNRVVGVLDQQRNDCVANGIAKAIQVAQGGLANLPSRNWIYYMAGCLEGSQKRDDGRFIRDALDALSTVGWLAEAAWPYDGDWDKHPGAVQHRMAYDNAKAIAPAYYRVDYGPERPTQIKQAIAAGHPVIIGSDVSQAWEDQDGSTPLPYDPAASSLGGHCYLVLGYTPEGLAVLNSWSDTWAAAGWGCLGWDWCDGFEDVWVLTLRTP